MPKASVNYLKVKKTTAPKDPHTSNTAFYPPDYSQVQNRSEYSLTNFGFEN